MKLFKAVLLTLFIVSSVFLFSTCKKFRKGVLEIQTAFVIGGELNYKAEIVDDGSKYKEGVEFIIPQNQNWKTMTGYYWPNKSANGLGYKYKEELTPHQQQSFSHKDGIKVPGKNGHWASLGGGSSTGYNCVSGNCVAVSSGAQYSTLSACQTSCSSSGTSVLYTTVLNGGSKDRQYAQFVVPAGVKSMEVRTNESTAGFSNQADLFVRRGSRPTCNADPFTGYEADCGSLSNNREQDFCKFISPPTGTWHVMLYNYNGASYKSNLVVTITK